MSSPGLNDQDRPRDFYSRRARELRAEGGEAAKLRSSYGLSLIVLGLIACIVLYASLTSKSFSPWTLVLAIPIGGYLDRRMRRYKKKAERLLRLAEYYDTGIARLDHKWELLEEGQEFDDEGHPYARDLDLFGRGSLFQLLCSARTQVGRETLANWMKNPDSREEILARHAAIMELRASHELRESLAGSGVSGISTCRPETFRTWVTESSTPFPKWGLPIAFLLALTAVVLPVLFWAGLISTNTLGVRFGALILVDMVFAAKFFRRVRTSEESVRPISAELPIVLEILQIAGRGNFSAAKLVAVATRMREGRVSVARLLRLVGLLRERDNPYSAYFSYFLMWGTQFTMAIDRWRRHHGTQLLEWLAAVGELDALISLSAYAYEHPSDVFPELAAKGPTLEAEGVRHPLLREDLCVPNDLRLGGDVRFLIVSGSNMSGKSTFIRAIGVNTVLAWMGAPVSCTKLTVSALAVAASVRVQDSVVDGRSHFLAEMQRLRRMIDLASETPLLYLADEIMSGTNSQDRRIATEWVVRALVLRGAVGIITTHDLALTEIASNGFPGRNAHFEDTGEAGNLIFDFKLRPGVLTHSNALNIAHMLGIDVAAAGESVPQKDPFGRAPEKTS